MTETNTVLGGAADSDADFARYGVTRGEIAQWEDGARTDGAAGTYEWWYFDAALADGASVIVVFLTKDYADPNVPLTPMIELNLVLPDGRALSKAAVFSADDFSASTENCDVRIGSNRFVGDLHRYRITAQIDDVEVDITITGEVAPWRSGTSYTTFGVHRDLEFAWLPSVPQGRVQANYSVAGEQHATTGVGYHDHNWGNVAMADILQGWYWARGEIGPYTIVASLITGAPAYGSPVMTVFMLAKGEELIGDDSSKVEFSEFGPYVDAHTGAPIANVTRYVYTDGGDRWELTYTRHRDILVRGARGDLGPLYHRMTGELRLEHFTDDVQVEQHVNTAIWERMYFAH